MRARLLWFLLHFPVTLSLCLAMLAMFGVEYAAGGTIDQAAQLRLGAMNATRVAQHGEIWRLFTAMFLHFGPIHLILNGVALAQLSALVEYLYGSHRTMAFFVVSGVFANLVSAWMTPSWMALGQVGASGAILGLAGVVLGLALYGVESYRVRLVGVVRPLVFGLALTFSFGLALEVADIGIRVDNWAHLGGLICGLAIALAYRDPQQVETRIDRVVGWTSGFAVVLSFGLMIGQGPRALESLPQDVVHVFEARLERSEEGALKAMLIAGLQQIYEDAGVDSIEERYDEALDGAAPATLRYLVGLYLAEERHEDLVEASELWVAREPQNAEALNALAWILVIHPDETARDPLRAADLASQALEWNDQLDLSGEDGLTTAYRRARALVQRLEVDPVAAHRAATLDTLAEARFQLGEYRDALRDQREAVQLAERYGAFQLDEMKARLERIEAAAE